MLNDVRIIEEVIEYLRDQLPKNISTLLADTEFNRGRASQLHDLIDGLERLSQKVDADMLVDLKDDTLD